MLTGIATWNFAGGSLADRIALFSGMGFDAVSLIMSDARAIARGEMPDAEEAILRRSLGVCIHGGLAAKDWSIDPDQLTADMELFTQWHRRTGALLTVNYDAAKIKTESGPEYDNQGMASVLDRLLSISQGAGFTVGIEDWPRNPEQLACVADLRKYPHYGMLIDLGHLNLRIRKPDTPDYPFPIEAARAYLDAMQLPVNELHIHNNDGKADRHAAPTTGTSDLAALSFMLKAKGVDCVSTIELVPAWCGLTEAEGLTAAREAMEYWREQVGA